MGIFKPKEDLYTTIIEDEIERKLIKKEDWEKFNSNVLGIGDLSNESVSKSVICAFFDLEGFTKFCTQIDPDLVIPVFLKKYLDWFFSHIQKTSVKSENPEGVLLWYELPFFIKFMGDGILLLWDISNMNIQAQGNIVISSLYITQNYVNDFFVKIKEIVTEPPKILRCGITKGKVYSVGNGEDFVGPCMNFASRLQKLPGITFAFSNRGLNLDKFKEQWKEFFIIKCVEARGIGENELIYIIKEEYDKLSPEYKKFYKEI